VKALLLAALISGGNPEFKPLTCIKSQEKVAFIRHYDLHSYHLYLMRIDGGIGTIYKEAWLGFKYEDEWKNTQCPEVVRFSEEFY